MFQSISFIGSLVSTDNCGCVFPIIVTTILDGLSTLINLPFAVIFFNFMDNSFLRFGGAQYRSYEKRKPIMFRIISNTSVSKMPELNRHQFI